MEKWLDEMKNFLVSHWGLDISFASRVGLLYAYFYFQGLNPNITSGFRDPEKQKALRDAWDSGNRAGLIRRPAETSLHSRVNGSGNPSAIAIDITTTNNEYAGQIAKYLGLGWGGDFQGNGFDPVHFYDKRGII